MFKNYRVVLNNGSRLYSNSKYADRIIPKNILKVSDQVTNLESKEKVSQINEAVLKYLKDYKENVEFLSKKEKEYEIGKRHLANLMGYDVNNITQDDIDNAISYLFPSGLFVKHSKPIMRPPSQIYPKFKASQYNSKGRPFSSFFYTERPSLNETSFQLYEAYQRLNKIEDKNIELNIKPSKEDLFEITKYRFLFQNELENYFVESLNNNLYENFTNHLKKLINHPYSNHESEFIKKFLVPLVEQKVQKDEIVINVDEDGREYVITKGLRKTVKCEVKVYKNGSGIFTINDKYDFNYFDYFISREQIMTPLVTADLVDKVDIYCKFEVLDKNAKQAQAGAIRLALSKALSSFVDEEKRENLRLHGLLQFDLRRKERKKPGKYKARKSHPHKKR